MKLTGVSDFRIMRNGKYLQVAWKGLRKPGGGYVVDSLGKADQYTKATLAQAIAELRRRRFGGEADAPIVGPRRHGQSLGVWLAEWEGDYERQQLADSTRDRIADVLKKLRDHFGDAYPLNQLDEKAAKSYRDWLATQPGVKAGTTLSDATVCTHLTWCKAIFKSLPGKPFANLRSTPHKRVKDWRVLRHADVDKLVESAPDDAWKALFALCSWGGCRRGEAFVLAWSDIDFNRDRMFVPEPKDARGKRTAETKYRKREVPLVPKLKALLSDIRSRTSDKTGPVVRMSHNNLSRDAKLIMTRAGLEPWDDPFQNLRRYRDTWWLVETGKPHVVAAWQGHSVDVMMEFYAQIPPELFDEAAKADTAQLTMIAELQRELEEARAQLSVRKVG